MCDVPSTAVFCNESTECFPGTASKFFLKLLVTIPVTTIIIGIIVTFQVYYYYYYYYYFEGYQHSNNSETFTVHSAYNHRMSCTS